MCRGIGVVNFDLDLSVLPAIVSHGLTTWHIPCHIYGVGKNGTEFVRWLADTNTTTMEKRELSLSEALDVCRALSFAIHDIQRCCGNIAATDLTLDLPLLLQGLALNGKTEEYVDYAHADRYHRMDWYAMRVDFELVGNAIKVSVERLNETDNEDSLAMVNDYTEILEREQKNGIYNIQSL